MSEFQMLLWGNEITQEFTNSINNDLEVKIPFLLRIQFQPTRLLRSTSNSNNLGIFPISQSFKFLFILRSQTLPLKSQESAIDTQESKSNRKLLLNTSLRGASQFKPKTDKYLKIHLNQKNRFPNPTPVLLPHPSRLPFKDSPNLGTTTLHHKLSLSSPKI